MSSNGISKAQNALHISSLGFGGSVILPTTSGRKRRQRNLNRCLPSKRIEFWSSNSNHCRYQREAPLIDTRDTWRRGHYKLANIVTNICTKYRYINVPTECLSSAHSIAYHYFGRFRHALAIIVHRNLCFLVCGI